MPNRNVRILNFDDSVAKQKGLVARFDPDIVDLKDIAPRARFWSNPGCKNIIRDRIKDSRKDAVTFLGSGDFHHITGMLVDGFSERACVISFDRHPDWTIHLPFVSCGSWVTEVLKNRNVLKVILLGSSSLDKSVFSLYAGDLGSLANDRVEIYPYSQHPSTVFFRKVPKNISFDARRGLFFTRIFWNELNSKNLVEFFLHVMKRLPSKKVYLTIDKDCLKKEYAVTNWQEGMMPLDELLLMIKLIKDNAEIIGADITGDYSEASVDGPVKKIFSRMNHPADNTAMGLQGAFIDQINEETNLKILDTLSTS